MSLSPEGLSALQEAVSNWRVQECIAVAFYAAYVYYYVTTLDEEVSVIVPQRWNMGKVLFVTMRYGTLIRIFLELARNYRTYFVIGPLSCKILFVTSEASYKLVIIATDAAIGLCICALLGARLPVFIVVMCLAVIYPVVALVFSVVGDIQFPAQPITGLDKELGYPCYLPSVDDLLDTLRGQGINIRQYVSFACTSIMLILAITTLVLRYQDHQGRLIHVIRRDGGPYYFTVTAMRFVIALLYTPSVIPVERRESVHAYVLTLGFQEAIVPILAQRILLNIRKVDYLGTRPMASAILFAPPQEDLLHATEESQIPTPDSYTQKGHMHTA